jgi:hypothetical protein
MDDRRDRNPPQRRRATGTAARVQQFPASEIRLETLEFMDFSPVSATLIC